MIKDKVKKKDIGKVCPSECCPGTLILLKKIDNDFNKYRCDTCGCIMVMDKKGCGMYLKKNKQVK